MYCLLVYRYTSLSFCNVIMSYIYIYIYLYVNCNNSVHTFHLLAVASSGILSQKASGHYNMNACTYV